jgi:V8-like Glu-specific endopeptidase
MHADHRFRIPAPRAGARLAALLLAVAALGLLSSTAAARAPGAIVHQVGAHPHPRAFWTRQRIRDAEPLPPVTEAAPWLSPLGDARDGGRPSYVAASPPGVHSDATAESGTVPASAADPSAHGTDTGVPTVFPNSANGVVLFAYGPDLYRCSGSVINSPAGNVVLTAGHCVIDPGPGTRATDIVYVPGYRDGAAPYGSWPATSFATTPEWENSTSTGDPNDSDEAGDIALLTLANRPSDGATIQSLTGAFGIGFNQPRVQTYQEYGYPAVFPYNGDRLYELTSPWARDDPSFSPATMGISSDFTGGSSGGPWLAGAPLVALSVNDYTYTSPPAWRGFMFGPYFGSIAQQLYATIQPRAPAAAALPSNAFAIKSLIRNRRRGRGVFRIEVPGAGRLSLSGDGLRAVHATALGAGIVRLVVRATGAARRELHNQGSVGLQATITFTPDGGVASSKQRTFRLHQRR